MNEGWVRTKLAASISIWGSAEVIVREVKYKARAVVRIEGIVVALMLDEEVPGGDDGRDEARFDWRYDGNFERTSCR